MLENTVIVTLPTYFVPISVMEYLLVCSPLFLFAFLFANGIANCQKPSLRVYLMFHGTGIMDWIVWETYQNVMVPFVLVSMLMSLTVLFMIRPWMMTTMTAALVFMLEYRYRKWLLDMRDKKWNLSD